MKRYLLPLLAAALLSGCDSPSEAHYKTQRNADHPEVITKLPDGREVKRIKIINPDTRDHYVYFIERADVTTNYSFTQGKTTKDEVTTSFDSQ